MSITAASLDALPDYTAAQLLKAVEAAFVAITLAGQTYTIGGRTFGRADLAELRRWRAQLQRESRVADGVDDTIALARFGDPA